MNNINRIFKLRSLINKQYNSYAKINIIDNVAKFLKDNKVFND